MSRAVADLPDEPDEAAVRASAGDASRADLLYRLSRLPAAHPSSDAYAHQDLASGKPERLQASGWDAPGVAGHPDRPAPETIRISPARRTHILDGDVSGGGHRHGTGQPGKTEFPAGWDDARIMEKVLDVARRPDLPPVHQSWNSRWLLAGTRDEIEISVVVQPDGQIWTAWPEQGSPGVIRNPTKGTS